MTAAVGVAPLTNILSGATQKAIQSIQQLTRTGPSLPKGNILDDIVNFFKNLGTKSTPGKISPGPTITPNLPVKNPSTILGVTKQATIITGLGTVGLLSLQTEAGQNIVNAGKDAAEASKSITQLLTENPIIPIGILIVVGLVLVGVKK